jgi:hypothetical protein
MRPSGTLNGLHKGRGAAKIATAFWAERSRDRAVVPLGRSEKNRAETTLGIGSPCSQSSSICG